MKYSFWFAYRLLSKKKNWKKKGNYLFKFRFRVEKWRSEGWRLLKYVRFAKNKNLTLRVWGFALPFHWRSIWFGSTLKVSGVLTLESKIHPRLASRVWDVGLRFSNFHYLRFWVFRSVRFRANFCKTKWHFLGLELLG